MQANDIFQRTFAIETARLSAWAEAQRDTAHIVCEPSGDFWGLRLAPHARNACPVELILHRTSQTYDIEIAGATWENQPVIDLARFQPALQALVDGRVVERRFHAAATHVPLGLEIEIGAAPAALTLRTPHTGPWPNAIVRTRAFAPYRRDRTAD